MANKGLQGFPPHFPLIFWACAAFIRRSSDRCSKPWPTIVTRHAGALEVFCAGPPLLAAIEPYGKMERSFDETQPGLITGKIFIYRTTCLLKSKKQTNKKKTKPFPVSTSKKVFHFQPFLSQPFFLHVFFFSRNQRRANIALRKNKFAKAAERKGETEKAIRQFPWASIDSVSYDEAFNGPLTP